MCCVCNCKDTNLKAITPRAMDKKKRASHFCKALCLIWRRPTFPLGVAVSSARQGLTSLFEMVRGVHLLYNHQKYLKYLFNPYNITHIQEGNYSEVFG